MEGRELRQKILRHIERLGFAVPVACARSQDEMGTAMDIQNPWLFCRMLAISTRVCLLWFVLKGSAHIWVRPPFIQFGV